MGAQAQGRLHSSRNRRHQPTRRLLCPRSGSRDVHPRLPGRIAPTRAEPSHGYGRVPNAPEPDRPVRRHRPPGSQSRCRAVHGRRRSLARRCHGLALDRHSGIRAGRARPQLPFSGGNRLRQDALPPAVRQAGPSRSPGRDPIAAPRHRWMAGVHLPLEPGGNGRRPRGCCGRFGPDPRRSLEVRRARRLPPLPQLVVWFCPGLQLAQLAAARSLPSLVSNGVVKPNEALKPAFQLASPDDANAPLELRARTWLHVQCAACHRFGAGAAVAARFAADEARTNLNVVDVKPTRGDFSLPSARIIAPGHPERSAAWYRINTSGAGHMPPVGSHLPDPAGSRLVADWIRSLAPDSQLPSRPARAPTNSLSALQWLDATLPEPPPEPIVRQAMSGNDVATRDLLAAYAPVGLRRDTLGDRIHIEGLLRLRGDARRGKDLFHSATGPGCARCHSVEPGVVVSGPSLAGIGRARTPGKSSPASSRRPPASRRGFNGMKANSTTARTSPASWPNAPARRSCSYSLTAGQRSMTPPR